MELENEELKQKLKILEEENARLRGELEVPKVNESFATTPTTHQMIPPTAQKMDREKENGKSDTCCCFICCISDDRSRNNNRDCCCCCCECEGGGSDSGCCEGGCDD